MPEVRVLSLKPSSKRGILNSWDEMLANRTCIGKKVVGLKSGLESLGKINTVDAVTEFLLWIALKLSMNIVSPFSRIEVSRLTLKASMPPSTVTSSFPMRLSKS